MNSTQTLTGKDYAEWLLSEVTAHQAEMAVKPKRLLTEAEMLAELEELRDGIADEEYHRSGNW